jgi:hypothetical protein
LDGRFFAIFGQKIDFRFNGLKCSFGSTDAERVNVVLGIYKHQMGLIFQKCIRLIVIDTKCHVKNKIVQRKSFFILLDGKS